MIAPPQDSGRQAAREVQRDKTQKKWDEYRISPSWAGHSALAQIASTRTLRPTKSNTADVLRLLESQGNGDDRQMYARLAGDLHDDLTEMNGDESLRRDIRESLARVVKNDRNQAVRKTAMFAYWRMGFFPDSLALLKSARPAMGDEDYHNEWRTSC